MEDNEQINSAKFNEGMFMTIRSHKSQEMLNDLKHNPEAFNMRYNTFNYIIIKRELDILLSESAQKFVPKEREDLYLYKKAIEIFMKVHPVHMDLKTTSHRAKSTFNQKNLDLLLEHLFNYEDLIRELREKHGLGNPNIEDEEGGWD